MLKTITVRTTIAAILAGLSMSTHAIADTARPINVPAGDLVAALESLAKQADIELVYQAEQLRGVHTGGVNGIYEPKEAVSLLLKGTQLTIRTDDATGVMLVAPPRASPSVSLNSRSRTGAAGAANASEPTKSFWARLRLAQSDTPSSSQGEGRGEDRTGATAESGGRGTEGRQLPRKEAVEEVVVTGTHIRGVREAVSPALTITRQEIARAGFSTLGSLFEALPQNFDEISTDGGFAAEGGSGLALQNASARVSAIDLRGLGAESTLTLLNGTRRAGSLGGRVVDISVIPISVIERVEVITDGRSAIYGSDAVGGVVNLVTRTGFDGFETTGSYGWARDGAERLQASQLVGRQTDRGSLVLAYDYDQSQSFNLLDTNLFLSPTRGGTEPRRLEIRPDSRRHSAFLAGSLLLGDTAEFYGDALFSDKRTSARNNFLFSQFGATNESTQADVNSNQTYSVAIGTRMQLPHSWAVDIKAARSLVDTDVAIDAFFDFGFFSQSLRSEQQSKVALNSLSVIADGDLSFLGWAQARAALGVELRQDEYRSHLDAQQLLDEDRDIHSLFAELHLPLLESGRIRGFNDLELSIAARFDEYSDFGRTFNPQIGVSWAPVSQLKLRGAWSTAFRAPGLVELSSVNSATLDEKPNSAGEMTPVLTYLGDNSRLESEEARTWTFGFDLEPTSLPGSRLSVSYFSIRYDNRIGIPAEGADADLILSRLARFPGLIEQAPTAQHVAQIIADVGDQFYPAIGIDFDPATDNLLEILPALVVFDNRTHNIAVEEVRGIDMKVNWSLETARGTVSLGSDATYTLEHKRKVTAQSPPFSRMDEVGKPVGFRVRGNAGWQFKEYGVFAFVDYVDDYSDPFSNPPGRMSSWTTADLTVQYQARGGALPGIGVSLAINNVFDRNPPRFRNGSFNGLGYDVTNADPIGRYLTLRVKKNW